MSGKRLDTLALVVLVAAVLVGLSVRVDAMRANPNVQHDEAWSYATASGRLGAFEKAMQSGLSVRWVPASAWQYYWQSDKLGDLVHIGPDLAAYDVHPPLYFYLLHLWLMLTGMHHWAGPALNLIFALLTMLALFGLARALGFERLESSLVVLAWALSPAVVSISALTRQYDLVALFTVLFVWGLVRVTAPGERRRWPDAVWLAAAACAALMTHYQTILLLLGGVVFAVALRVIGRRTERRRPWAPAVIAIAAGVVLAGLLTPGFTHAFGREGSRVGGFTGEVFREKLASIGQTLGRAAGLPGPAAAAVALAVLAAVVVALLVPRSRRAIVAAVRGARPGWWTVLFFLVVTAGGVCLQNLAFLSLPPLLTSRYLAMAWPFFAFPAAARLRPVAALAAPAGGRVLPARAAAHDPRDASALRQPAARAARPAALGERHPDGHRGPRRAAALPLGGAGRHAGVRGHPDAGAGARAGLVVAHGGQRVLRRLHGRR